MGIWRARFGLACDSLLSVNLADREGDDKFAPTPSKTPICIGPAAAAEEETFGVATSYAVKPFKGLPSVFVFTFLLAINFRTASAAAVMKAWQGMGAARTANG